MKLEITLTCLSSMMKIRETTECHLHGLLWNWYTATSLADNIDLHFGNLTPRFYKNSALLQKDKKKASIPSWSATTCLAVVSLCACARRAGLYRADVLFCQAERRASAQVGKEPEREREMVGWAKPQSSFFLHLWENTWGWDCLMQTQSSL